MPNQNNAVCDLMCVPFNPNGLFTVSFGSNGARDSALSGYVVSGQVGFTYLPKEGVLKVDGNANGFDSLGVNYVRFKNTDFSGDYIYAFVRRIEYLAQFTSALHIEVDSFMTYQTKIVPNQCFIERERVSVSEDYVGANLLPEPVSFNSYHRRERGYRSESVAASYAGVVISGLNITDNDPNENAKIVLNGNGVKFTDGCPLGGSLICVAQGQDLTNFIECIAVLNGKIITAFPVPSERIVHLGTITYNRENNTSDTFDYYTIDAMPLVADVFSLTGAQDDNPWGFTPKNKKLFTYPYILLEGDNHCGTRSLYRYDLFSGNPRFEYRYIISPSPSLVVNPLDYEGGSNIANAIINANVPPIPWDSNAYTTYVAQNANSLAFAQIKRNMNYGVALLGGLPDGKVPLAASYDAAMAYEGEQARLQDLKGLGDDVHNVPSANAQSSFQQIAISVYQKYITSEEARRIDNFFSRFGYRVDRVGTISWGKRSDYDYIKTQGANIGGQIPAADKAKINALFDAGITIWHSMGGYGQYDIV